MSFTTRKLNLRQSNNVSCLFPLTRQIQCPISILRFLTLIYFIFFCSRILLNDFPFFYLLEVCTNFKFYFLRLPFFAKNFRANCSPKRFTFAPSELQQCLSVSCLKCFESQIKPLFVCLQLGI